MTQLSIFSARQSRDSALSRVESHASREWLDAAFAALRGYLERNPTFHCDDAWTFLERPAESRALGAVILRAKREELMRCTSECRPSVSSRMSVKPVWASLIFKGTP